MMKGTKRARVNDEQSKRKLTNDANNERGD